MEIEMLAITGRRRPLEDLPGALADPRSRLLIGLLAIGVFFARRSAVASSKPPCRCA